MEILQHQVLQRLVVLAVDMPFLTQRRSVDLRLETRRAYYEYAIWLE